MTNPFANQGTTWVEGFAHAVYGTCPYVAQGIRSHGINSDPSPLIQELINTPQTPLGAACATVLISIEQELVLVTQQRDHNAGIIAQVKHDLAVKTAEFAAQKELLDDSNDQLAKTAFRQPETEHTGPRGKISDDPGTFEPSTKDHEMARQLKYITWKSKVQVALIQDKHIYVQEWQKILYVTSKLGGTIWSDHRDDFVKMTNNQEDPTKWTWKTLKEVWDEFDKAFITVNIKMMASMKFRDLHYDNPQSYGLEKKDFSTFLSSFITQATRAGKTDEQKVEALKQKVSSYLRSRFAGLLEPPKSDAWDKWLTLTRKFEENRLEYQHNEAYGEHKKHNHNSTHNHNHAGKTPLSLPSVQPPQSGGDPMELDRMILRLSRLSEAERDMCMRQNLCFFCRVFGHRIDECPRKYAADQAAMSSQTTMYRPPTYQPAPAPPLYQYQPNPQPRSTNPFQGARPQSNNPFSGGYRSGFGTSAQFNTTGQATSTQCISRTKSRWWTTQRKTEGVIPRASCHRREKRGRISWICGGNCDRTI